MAEYEGVYGHPYPRVDQYGNPVPPFDQYGNPIPVEPPAAAPCSSVGAGSPSYVAGAAGIGNDGYLIAAPDDHGTGAVSYGLAGTAHPHEGVVSGDVAPGGAAGHPHEGVVGSGVAAGEPVYAYEGVVSSAGGTAAQLKPTREEHATLGETLRRSGSSSSSSSSEDDGQGGRRKKKSIKEKIKEKLPGSHKHEEHKAGHAAGTGTHAAGAHEKKGIMEKIKEKLPGHH